MSSESEATKQLRGKGRGSSFSVLDRAVWSRLWEVPATNRLNLVSAFIVLLAGTGADHRLTKWSAKACEDYVGMGKPRAQLAIGELIDAGLIERTEGSTRLRPQYLLKHLPDDADPIFLPNQLVTGLSGETPVLRRVRETGDPLLLRMLIDMYGLIQLDATFSLPLSQLREAPREPSRKVAELGANAVWALPSDHSMKAKGDWVRPHYNEGPTAEASWANFWDRVSLLKKIGALIFEPWVFDGDGEDAEPMFPINVVSFYAPNYHPDEEAELTSAIIEVSEIMLSEQAYALERYSECLLLPLPLHHRSPAIQGVAKMRVEADTPGRRMTFAQRKKRLRQYAQAIEKLKATVVEGAFDAPLRLSFGEEAA
ncbi:hypothetical protein [Novosphingobium sp. M1R2S20]|uniref:Uncharacterized protein n=1 Tax=Novosphingobium rhizovicinum TaxID=3228928 RepID=A0ABV3R727_9SPHN